MTSCCGAERLLGVRASVAIGREFFALPLGAEVASARAALTRLGGDAKSDASEQIEFDTPQSEGPAKRAVLRFVRLVDGAGALPGSSGSAGRASVMRRSGSRWPARG